MKFSEYVRNETNIFKSKEKGNTIGKYAKLIGVSRETIHNMMKGEYNSPSVLTAKRICKWFNLEPSELVKMLDVEKPTKFVKDIERWGIVEHHTIPIYILTESFQSEIDGLQINHSIFRYLEDAKQALKDKITEIKQEASENFDTEEVDEESASFYKSGFASQWDLELFIEKAILPPL